MKVIPVRPNAISAVVACRDIPSCVVRGVPPEHVRRRARGLAQFAKYLFFVLSRLLPLYLYPVPLLRKPEVRQIPT